MRAGGLCSFGHCPTRWTTALYWVVHDQVDHYCREHTELLMAVHGDQVRMDASTSSEIGKGRET